MARPRANTNPAPLNKTKPAPATPNKPGQPGNTAAKGGSRPGAGAKPKAVTELHAMLFSPERAEAAAEQLFKLARLGDLDAIKYILDRTFGKAKQSIDMNVSGSATLALVDRARADLIAQAASAAGKNAP